MTCIIGIETKDGKVVIGGDTLGSNGHSSSEINESKVFSHSNMIFGYTSSFRFGQIVEVMLDNNKIHTPQTKDTYKWMIGTFIPMLQSVLKENEASTGVMLVGVNGQLYNVQSDFSVLRNSSGFDSVGSGDTFAIGAVGFQVLSHGKPENLEDANRLLKSVMQVVGTNCVSVSTRCNTVSL